MMREHTAADANADANDKGTDVDGPASQPEPAAVAGSGAKLGFGGQGLDGQLTKPEERAEGAVRADVYRFYLVRFGAVPFLAVVAAFCGGQGGKVGTDWWLGRWSEGDGSVVLFAGLGGRGLLGYYLGVWIALSGLQVSQGRHRSSTRSLAAIP
jgi:hypothetical protein